VAERRAEHPERDDMVVKHDALKQQRARLMAEAAGYQMELEEVRQEQARLRTQVQVISDERSDLTNLHEAIDITAPQ
jgi:phage shock protein A